MPTFCDIAQFLSSQALGSTTLPVNCDLSDKTIIVTGGNTGLGLDAAKHLARLGVSYLILAVRNVEKGEKAKGEIAKQTKCHTLIEVWQVDLSNYGSVLSFAVLVRLQLKRLDGLIPNAGVEKMWFETAEDLESTLTVNVISTTLMSCGVLPKLKETSIKHGTRTNLTIVGSLIHFVAPVQQLDIPRDQKTFTALSDPKTADIAQRYPLSKLMITMLFLELAQRVEDSRNEGIDGKHQVVVNCVNPGWCGTELGRDKTAGLVERISFATIGWTCEKGSKTLVNGVCAGMETCGQFLSECQPKPCSAYVRSAKGKETRERLWKETTVRISTLSPETAAFVQ
ncbi:hypothetical protein LTR37_012217 [Vermiconidia calcicola]|uniref:Uncharacterized protein n=1 Tax=Vermiconidia calcicola TaxID=1690605 RepID=A0ACC3N2K9_9PEZI|nr:hypothetical protein LTR37_012217 [Vermiconidia calcicola]